MPAMGFVRGKRSRLLLVFAILVSCYLLSSSSNSSSSSPSSSASSSSRKSKSSPYKNAEIQKHNIIERITFPASSEKVLDPQRYPFLQARMGREEDEPTAIDDVMASIVRDGVEDYWERFQKPSILGSETMHIDNQLVRSAIEDLLSLNGWVASSCPTLIRPFQKTPSSSPLSSQLSSTTTANYDDLIAQNNLYYIAIVIHSADHFLVDQLAVIVQLAKRLGPTNIFVSMLDYYSTDATPTILDLSEAVLTLLGVPFRIRRVGGLTPSDASSYYPLEEAFTRNLVLEPLHELSAKRSIRFSHVVWLKGFTCPNDILESLKISYDNKAALVCGMDWAEHNGFFIFSDRWRTRDVNGDQFRQSKSTSAPPPRDPVGAERYANHLPFQVFCCESGTHIVDPAQSYYTGIHYRHAENFANLTKSGVRPEDVRVENGDEACMDSSQAFFCRDIWIESARAGMREKDPTRGNGGPAVGINALGTDPGAGNRKIKKGRKRQENPVLKNERLKDTEPELDDSEIEPVHPAPAADEGSDANRGSDYDAMPEPDDGDVELQLPSAQPPLQISNTLFTPARILVNPRCVTTYAGVSHTQLAQDLFGEEAEMARAKAQGGTQGTKSGAGVGGKYVLDDWEGAPDSFVCQEQRQTGGRKATKTQRRLGFSIHEELQKIGEDI